MKGEEEVGLKPRKWGTTKDAITTRLSLEPRLFFFFFYISNKNVIRTLKKRVTQEYMTYTTGDQYNQNTNKSIHQIINRRDRMDFYDRHPI